MNDRYQECLVRLIRELTEVARAIKAFEGKSAADARGAAPPEVRRFAPTGLREIDAVANMFMATYGVLRRHVARLEALLVEPAEPATKMRATVLASALDEYAPALCHDDAGAALETLGQHGVLMGAVAARHGGEFRTVDGASFLMVFGTEASDAAPASARACGAGLEVLAALDQFNAYRARRKKRPLRCSVGIHSGELFVGGMLVSGKTVSTAFGPAVAGAWAVQREAAGEVRPLLLSAATAQELGQALAIAPLKGRTVRMGRETIPLFSLAQPPPHTDHRALLDEMFGVLPVPPEDESAVR